MKAYLRGSRFMNAPNTNQLLQAMLSELRDFKQHQSLGFNPNPRYIYANRKYDDCLWYFWDGINGVHEPIKSNSLTGIVDRLSLDEKSFKGKVECKVNLHIDADCHYVIQTGFATKFAQGLLYALSELPSSALSCSITTGVEAGDSDEVLFCRITSPRTGKRFYAQYKAGEIDWEAVAKKAIANIDNARGRGNQQT